MGEIGGSARRAEQTQKNKCGTPQRDTVASIWGSQHGPSDANIDCGFPAVRRRQLELYNHPLSAKLTV